MIKADCASCLFYEYEPCTLFTVYENNLFLLLQAEGKLIFIYRDNLFCLRSCFKSECWLLAQGR